MNQLTIIGNIGQDAIIRDNNNRKAINFHVAVNKSYKDKDGVKVENTVWYSCTYWKNENQSAEIAKYLVAGTQVMVQGEPSARAYQGKDGKWNASLDLNVEKLQLIGAKKPEASQTGNPQASQPANQAPAQANYDIQPNPNFEQNGGDDLPF